MKPGRTTHSTGRERAFTRGELLAVLVGVSLLLAVTWPVLANSRERSLRVLCVNNLRLAGQAYQQWGTEHAGRLPWRTPWCEGGTMAVVGQDCPESRPPWVDVGLYNNPWFQWAWLTNEIRSPRILACPSDTQKQPATTWTTSSNEGFFHPNYRNGAISYFIGLDVFSNDRVGLIAGDRNLRFNLGGGACSSGITYNASLYCSPFSSPGIGSGLHVEAGNFLFLDGSVEELSSQGFNSRWAALWFGEDAATAHYLQPN
jgi:prepilin-type processing-associated H-X9-DG protein